MAERNPYDAGPPSDHFDGLRFFNPGAGSTDCPFSDILKWKPRDEPVEQLASTLAEHSIGPARYPAAEPGDVFEPL